MDLVAIFLTGLSVGGLTCLAVQGGLLATLLSGKRSFFPTIAFLAAKLVAYTLLGFILGAFGGAININGQVQSAMQLLAGLYMLAVALNLLNVHPVFRYAVIQPPKFLTRLVRDSSKSQNFFAPLMLGAMTIFIPCGTTLAMEALAISSTSAVQGAAIMAAFVLGTIPVFFIIGFLTTMLDSAYKNAFLKFAALLIIFLGLFSIRGSLSAFGLLNINQNLTAAPDQAATNNILINITSRGYTPNFFRVKAGEPITLTVTNSNSYSCASAFRIPSFGISANLMPGQSQTFTITPTKPGRINFSCSMGMYSGVIEVI